MAYGSGGNGRNGNGRTSNASRRYTQQESASDAWREELKALQQRARSRSRRNRQKPRGALRAAVITMVVVTLGFAGLGLMAFLGAMHMASSFYANINRDLPSINQIAGRETFKTAQLYRPQGQAALGVLRSRRRPTDRRADHRDLPVLD